MHNVVDVGHNGIDPASYGKQLAPPSRNRALSLCPADSCWTHRPSAVPHLRPGRTRFGPQSLPKAGRARTYVTVEHPQKRASLPLDFLDSLPLKGFLESPPRRR